MNLMFTSSATNVGILTHPGIDKQYHPNEDSVLCEQANWQAVDGQRQSWCLVAVADGMSGPGYGHEAALMATQALSSACVHERLLDPTHPLLPTEEELFAAVAKANRTIRAWNDVWEREAGTTLVAALVIDKQAWIANVGDSRAYHYHAGRLTQLTRDHSLVTLYIEQGILPPEALYTHPRRNVIYRFLGIFSEAAVDLFRVTLAPGDRLLLCSDGLWSMLSDAEIAQILADVVPPQEAAQRLIEQANASGGHDNSSAIVLDIPPVCPTVSTTDMYVRASQHLTAMQAARNIATVVGVLLQMLVSPLVLGTGWLGRACSLLVHRLGHALPTCWHERVVRANARRLSPLISVIGEMVLIGVILLILCPVLVYGLWGLDSWVFGLSFGDFASIDVLALLELWSILDFCAISLIWGILLIITSFIDRRCSH